YPKRRGRARRNSPTFPTEAVFAATALPHFTRRRVRIYRAYSRLPAGDRGPCFPADTIAEIATNLAALQLCRTRPRSTFDVGAQPGQDLRPALMAFVRGLAHEA